MSNSFLEFALPDAPATEALGAALARAYRRCEGAPVDASAGAGSLSHADLGSAPDTDAGAVIYLQGELGAGKTTCARSLLRTFGVTGLIRSPTYTLVEVYRLAALTCVHVDLYRLAGPEAVEELGLRDFLGPDCLLLVEWPAQGGNALPPPDLDVTFTYAQDSRRARLEAKTAPGLAWLEKLQHDTSLARYVSHLT